MTRSEGELPGKLHALLRTLQLGYRAEPRLLLTSLGMTLFGALPDALVALWLKLLVDGLEQKRSVLLTAAAIGLSASATLTWYLRTLFDRLDRRFRDRVSIALESHVARLQSSIASIEHQERPEYVDRLAMLRDQVFALDHMFLSLFATLGWVFRLATTFILLLGVHPALGLLALFALPTIGVGSWRPAVERTVWERSTHHTRLARHLFLLGTTPSPAKEVRVTNLGEWLERARHETWRRWYDEMSRARWVSAAWNATVWALFGAAYVAAIAFVAIGLHAPPGQTVLVLVAGGVLSHYVAAFVTELGFLRGFWLDSSRRLTWLEDYAARSGGAGTAEVPARLASGIQFEHVDFRYPGTDRDVLQDVSLQLPAGAVVAVVGENGAGKSTLVKLLCRMYPPTRGRIAVDGVDLAALPVSSWRERLAGAFQDFFRFELAAQGTIGVGDLPRLEQRPAVETAVDRAGANELVSQLVRGLDTQLGADWDGGVDVSFGQWQKLALARGFMRDAPLLLVLDEPTAALDAETEHALFERYAAASRQGDGTGRITLLVSHRFSTVRMADLIVVLRGSRVVEVGAHEELMAKRGTYAELFDIQATAYR